VPIVGKVWAAEVRAATAVVTTFTDVVDAFVERGKQLQEFSGELTTANVQADIRSMMADIKEAQELGDSLAQLTDAQSRASNEIRELLLPIKKVVTEVLAGMLQTIVDVIVDVKAGIAAVRAAVQESTKILGELLVAIVTVSPFKAGATLAQAPERMTSAITQAVADARKSSDEEPADTFFQQQLDALKQQRGVGPNFGLGVDPLAGGALPAPAPFALE
jgi:hypothetical protein